jgi:class 3 adenylate cyclase
VSETRKLAAILVADIVGYSRLAGVAEDRILARLRTLRSDLIDPILAVHHGRVVKRTGDGAIIEFRSVVDAVRCAIEVQSGLAGNRRTEDPQREDGVGRSPFQQLPQPDSSGPRSAAPGKMQSRNSTLGRCRS